MMRCHIPSINVLGLVVSDKKVLPCFLYISLKHVTPGVEPLLAPGT